MSDVPRVTLVVTQREGFRPSCASIDDIYAKTRTPFRLIYCDAGSPPEVATGLRERASRLGFTLMRSDRWAWPNLARRAAMPHVATEYTAFIDNDITVEPSWLDALLQAADETKAAIVAPLYLIARPGEETVIHMAGGVLSRQPRPGGVTLLEAHRLADSPLSMRDGLQRGPCDYVEFHCALVRTAFLQGGAALDPTILAVHEHIDLSLQAHRAGLPVIFEPASAITYHPPARLDSHDRAVYARRWDKPATEASIAAFCAKWGVLDDPAAFDGVRTFAHHHGEIADPLARGRSRDLSAESIMSRAVPQTWIGFANYAHSLGFSAPELAVFSNAYGLAQPLFSGGFRLCGRPFLCHLVGVGGVLASYGATPDLVAAGLLHAVYTHSRAPDGPASLAAASAQIRARCGGRIELILQAYARYTLGMTPWPTDPAALDEVELAAMILAHANRVEEFLSGEATSTISAVQTPDFFLQSLKGLGGYLNAPWLVALADRASRTTSRVRYQPRMSESHWLGVGQDQPVPMRHRHFETWNPGGTVRALAS